MRTRRHFFTIGHGNRSDAAFTELVVQHGIDTLVDVRSYPGSRRNPQFNRTSMAGWLARANVEYLWFGSELGGRRKPLPDSRNCGLGEDGLRGFADYMATARFSVAIDDLLALEPDRRIALMCAEGDPGTCHRRFIADHLLTLGVDVTHILSATTVAAHVLHERARVAGGRLVYDQGVQTQMF